MLIRGQVERPRHHPIELRQIFLVCVGCAGNLIEDALAHRFQQRARNRNRTLGVSIATLKRLAPYGVNAFGVEAFERC